jgi:hypothetical protein
MGWDPEAVSQRFLRAAATAEDYLREVRSKIASQPTYGTTHDQTLAEYYVYNHLHGRTWLDTRETLLTRLRDMIHERLQMVSEAQDIEAFHRFRRRLLEHLVFGILGSRPLRHVTPDEL